VNKTTIFTKTAKGTRAASVASNELDRDLRNILNAIDGKSSVDALHSKFENLSAAELDEALDVLALKYLIRESTSSIPAFVSSSQSPAADVGDEQADASVLESSDGSVERSTLHTDESLLKAKELRAKIRGRREGADRRSVPEEGHKGTEHPAAPEAGARDRNSEEQDRLDAEEVARREATERARQEAEEQARREVEEQARREAEEEARREAAELARQEAEEQVRRKAEEQVRREAEAEARREAAERVHQEAEEQARRDAEEATRREAAERARQEAAASARQAAEEQAWREAEEKLRREEGGTKRKRGHAKATTPDDTAGSEKPRKWGKALALGFVALVVIGLVMIHLISFDGQIPQFEKLLAGQFQQPVTIKTLHLSLVPQPYLRLEGVSIGSEGQIKIPLLKATGALGNLTSDRKVFKSLELDSPAVTEEGLGWILFGKPLASNMEFGQVSALNVKLESKNVNLSAFDAKLLSDGEGAWKNIVIDSVDKNLSLELTPKGRSIQIDFKAKTFKIPFGSALTLEDWVATGTADSSGLTLTEFKGFVHGGILGGNARLQWGNSWSLVGELNAKQIDTSQLVSGLLDGGRLAGAASYSMQAPEAAKLFSALHLEGSFIIPWGTLLGVDLGSVLQGGATRGDTKFSELAGSFVHDLGVTQLRQVRLSQGNVSANGMADVDAERKVHGRIAAMIKLTTGQRRADLVVAGNLDKIEWRRQ
jgi:hypothetical protein